MNRLSSPSFCRVFVLSVISCLVAMPLVRAQADSTDDHRLTEIFDSTLEPKIVTPAAKCGGAPSDAIILFNGENQDEWVSANDGVSPSDWVIQHGILTVNKTAGSIQTKRKFTNYQLHVEWRVPTDIEGSDQARGNSGVFLANPGPGEKGYELQVLDSYHNKTYFNGQAASIYKQSIPLANASLPPGEWQTYDVVWTAPVFNTDGSLTSPARVTAFHNGVLVQNNFELKGITRFRGKPYYKAHGPCPIQLQAHGDKSKPISYRNIWVRPL
jgi:Domain of Unknown Function (DUF1080)